MFRRLSKHAPWMMHLVNWLFLILWISFNIFISINCILMASGPSWSCTRQRLLGFAARLPRDHSYQDSLQWAFALLQLVSALIAAATLICPLRSLLRPRCRIWRGAKSDTGAWQCRFADQVGRSHDDPFFTLVYLLYSYTAWYDIILSYIIMFIIVIIIILY